MCEEPCSNVRASRCVCVRNHAVVQGLCVLMCVRNHASVSCVKALNKEVCEEPQVLCEGIQMCLSEEPNLLCDEIVYEEPCCCVSAPYTD